MVKGREPPQSRVQGSSSSPLVESTTPGDPAVAPDFNTGAIDGSVWDHALNGADLMAGLEDIGTWYVQESYGAPLLDEEYREYLFNSSVFELPAGFDLFSSGNPTPNLHCNHPAPQLSRTSRRNNITERQQSCSLSDTPPSPAAGSTPLPSPPL
jgi:hypothetical protein